MNVHLAAQVLSTSVSVALKEYDNQKQLALQSIVKCLTNFLIVFNVPNTTECITKQKPFLSPYTSVDDERFEWLISTILPYFTNWKNSIESRRGGPYSNTDKARLFISWQTHDHTFINRSYKIPFQVKYVLTECFCPDPLENYFGRQRSMGRHRDNPNKNF